MMEHGPTWEFIHHPSACGNPVCACWSSCILVSVSKTFASKVVNPKLDVGAQAERLECLT